MPRSKPSALTVPQSSSPESHPLAENADARERYDSYTSPVSDDNGTSPLEPPAFSVPASPASPRQASRSFWGRNGRKVRVQTQDATPGRLPSAEASSSNLPVHEATIRPVSPSTTSSPEHSYPALMPERVMHRKRSRRPPET